MIDLTELLEERSRVVAPPADERLSAVERRIVRRRRRRVAGAGAGVLAVAVAAAVALPRMPDQRPEPVAAPPSPAASASVRPQLGPFAEYADGYRVVAVGSAPVSAGSAQVSWTVASSDVQLFTYCPGLSGKAVSLDGDLSVGGTPLASVNCPAELHQDATESGLPGLPGALTTGQTATIGYRITGARAGGGQGTIYLAVAERVPFAEFPLPARPAVVRTPAPDGIGTEPGGKIVHSDPADPRRTVTTTMVWRYGYDVSLAVLPSTPGIYTVAIDGTTVGTAETYDYRGGGKGWSYAIGKDGSGFAELPRFADGRTVTVTFAAEHATGPWLGELSTTPTN